MVGKLLAGMLAVAAMLAGKSASAELDQPLMQVCTNQETPRAALRACTLLIETGGLTRWETAWVYTCRGFAYTKQRDYDRAIADYSKAIGVEPKFAAAYSNRGDAYSATARFDLALGDYSKAINIFPRYKDAYNNRGLVYSRTGQYERAIADYDKALQIDPTVYRTLNNRGIANLKFGRYEDAVADFDASYRIAANAFALYGRGVARLQTEDTAGGDADLAAARKMEPDIAQQFAAALEQL